MLSFEQVEDCFPDGACCDDIDGRPATGKVMVSAQWLHDFGRAIEAAVLAEQAKQEPLCYLIENWLSYDQSAEGVPGAFPVFLHPSPAPEGMVLVPREPTEAMMEAASDVTRSEWSDPRNHFRSHYVAMIAAAENETRK